MMVLHTAFGYTSRSVLSSGQFVKISVEESGIYRLTYEQIVAAGLNPQNLRILGYGGAMLNQDFSLRRIDDLPSVPYYRHTGADGKFGEGDYILFYAQGIFGWTWNGVRFRHSINPYSTKGYYFLSDSAGEQILLTPNRQTIDTNNTLTVTTFYDHQVHEQETVNLIDKKGESGGGREFYGETIASGGTYTYTQDIPNIVSGSMMRIYVDYAVDASTQNSTLSITNNSETKTNEAIGMAYSDYLTEGTNAWFNTTFEASGSSRQQFKLQYKHTDATKSMHLNYIELTAKRQLTMANNLLIVTNTDNYRNGESGIPDNLYQVENVSQETQVWNITKLDSIYSEPTSLSGSQLLFRGTNDELQNYVVINPSKCEAKQPTIIGQVSNQNLHAIRNVDYVVISYPDFADAAQDLVNAHKQYDGLRGVVVTSEQVYNEFSSGTPDATAYRSFMKFLYDTSDEASRPKYLLLMGDGSFDNRKLLTTSAYPYLLTYQSRSSLNEVEAYATDDYFGFLADDSGLSDTSDKMLIAVGRLPVKSSEEARAVVNKTIRYMQGENLGSWRQQLCFLADDGDSGLHTRCIDTGAEKIRESNPNFIVTKIYTDAYRQETSASGESYPIAKAQLDNMLKDGVLYFNYSGHAGSNNISSEQMLTAKEIRQMTNQNQGFWMLATCNFAQFDAARTSAAEEAVLNENGGAIGLLASCRTVYAEKNQILNDSLSLTLFQHDENNQYMNTIGEATRLAKNGYATSVKDKNKLPYILLADPALKLHYPTDYKVEITEKEDTLRAISRHSIHGNIVNHDGGKVSEFNGVIYINIYDKMQRLTTLDNDQTDPSKKRYVTYNDYPNKIFSGSAKVEDGEFTVDFMIPKDIRYNFGQGRIVFYAQDTEHKKEAVGNDMQTVIGGSSDIEITDNEGPEIKIYLNNPQFQSGDKTHPNPRFYARITDENGINTIGNGIGHDLMLVVDEDILQTYSLNSYYTSDLGHYQSGGVNYLLPTQEEGFHSLTFRAWDLLNNSTTVSLDYEVVNDLDARLFSVITYPNPMRMDETVHFSVQHDHPDDILQVQLYVFDLSGYMVYHYEQEGTADIDWNTSNSNLRKGIYFYTIRIKTSDTDYTSGHGKIICL